MAVGMRYGFGWQSTQPRSDGAWGRAGLVMAAAARDLEYAATSARITPVLTALAPYAPNLCATVTPQGEVILDGRVSDPALAGEAVAEVAAIRGVQHVHNQLFTDGQIADLIMVALALDERTTCEAITVTCERGVVTLRGVVTSVEACQAAEAIARHAPLVWRVENMLLVQQPGNKEEPYGIAPACDPTINQPLPSSGKTLPARRPRRRAGRYAGGRLRSGRWSQIA